MSVVSLVILPVNAVCVVVQGDVVAAVRDIAGAQVMDEGDFTESVIFYFLGCLIYLVSYHTCIWTSSWCCLTCPLYFSRIFSKIKNCDGHLT